MDTDCGWRKPGNFHCKPRQVCIGAGGPLRSPILWEGPTAGESGPALRLCYAGDLLARLKRTITATPAGSNQPAVTREN
jgi:hypothetical protein